MCRRTQKTPIPLQGRGFQAMSNGEERGSGVGLTAVVGGVALAGAAFAGALAHVSSKWGTVNGPFEARSSAFRARKPPVRARCSLLWHMRASGDDLVGQSRVRRQSMANHLKLTMMPVNVMPLSSVKWRECQTQVCIRQRALSACHDQNSFGRKSGIGASPQEAPVAPLRKGFIMKTIAKVIEPCDIWSWGGIAPRDIWSWGG